MKDKVKKSTQEALGKRNGALNNAAVVNKIGNEFSGGGLRDINQPDSAENRVDAYTMFGEGSVGKMRYAGLSYVMEQEGVFGAEGLQQNAKNFFRQRGVGDFLEQKYPGRNLQAAIINLFTDGSEKATLADLTTHRSGIGDTTLDALAMVKSRGTEYPFTFSDLVLSQPESAVPRNEETGKPMARKGPKGDPSRAIYGEHEYSNLGYQVLAAAMEAAYFMHTGIEKDYQKLTEDFMLHPIEGRAVGRGLSFDQTKFPQDLEESDNVVQAKIIEKDKDGNDVVANANRMSAANAAGGMFASANDSTKFFSEYFKGFPGTTESGKDVNPFFTPDTIKRMWQEAHKHPSYANQTSIDEAKVKLAEWNKRNAYGELAKGDERPLIPNPQFQFPGAVANTDLKGDVVSYVKGGGTSGYISRLEFDAKSGEANISMINQENLTSHREKLAEQEKGLDQARLDSWVNKVRPEIKSEEQTKSFVERIKADQTKGKSSGGSYEL